VGALKPICMTFSSRGVKSPFTICYEGHYPQLPFAV